MTTELKKYVVGTNGLAGRCKYQATDPDQALMYAYRHERFLRLQKKRPDIPPTRAIQIAKDELEMPDFKIDFCFLDEGD